MPIHVVEQGECLSSIAERYGFAWETVWNLSQNSDLRAKRPDPNLIYPGDEVYVPELARKDEAGAVEKRHRFKMKGVPSKLRIRLLNNGLALANRKWKCNVDGKWHDGATDGDGHLEMFVRPNANLGMLEVEDGPTFELQLRTLDPLETISGVQARLNNLGYDSGEVDGIQGPITTAAIKAFQADYPPLDVDGIVGPKTRAQLKDIYGC
jgi:hypothetical protein